MIWIVYQHMTEFMGEKTTRKPWQARPCLAARNDCHTPASPSAFIRRQIEDEPDTDATVPWRKVIHKINPHAVLIGRHHLFPFGNDDRREFDVSLPYPDVIRFRKRLGYFVATPK
ncbi:MAG TPA: hypothetical protein VIG57_06995 [Candidatus Entotheonella sp.]